MVCMWWTPYLRAARTGLPVLLLCAFALNAAVVSPTMVLDHDEVQHLHIAWLVAEGDRPFVDFADNHNHLFPHLLTWTMPDNDDPARPVAAARGLMLACTALTLALAGLLAAQWSRRDVALLAPLALAGSGYWMVYGLAVRPDVPMTAAVVAGWLLFARGRRRDSMISMVGAGLAWGLGAALLLKAALAVVPAGGLLLVDLARRRGERGRALGMGLGLLAGLLVPVGAFVAWTAAQGLWGPFWFWIVEFNAAYLTPTATDPGFGVGEVLAESLRRDVVLVAVAAAGLPLLLRRFRSDGVLAAMAIYVALVFASTLGINQPNYQYLLPALALLPVLGAAGIEPACAALARRWPRWRTALPVLTCLAVLIAASPSLGWIHDLPGNDVQLTRMKRVLDLVPPDRTVLAAPPAHPILRRDALYLWFNNPRFHNVLTRVRPPPPMDRWETDPARLREHPPDVILKTDARYHGAYGVGALAGARYMSLVDAPEILVLDTRIRELTRRATEGSGSAP